MLISAHRPLNLRRTRDAFTLLEVLVVVAIIVILAGAAGVGMFKYLEGAKVDTAKAQMTNFENAAKAYALRNNEQPPASLNELVTPSDGSKPYIDGGQNSLISPFGTPYQYDPSHQDSAGSPDPLVWCVLSDGTQIYSTKHKNGPNR
jgi:general secretion pathway protein G